MVKVTKRSHESEGNLIRRFKHTVRNNGVISLFVERSRFKKPSEKRQEILKQLKRKGYKK